MAELARLGRVSRVRVTQIMDLLMLAPDVQEELLFGKAAVRLRELMPLFRQTIWSEQQRSEPGPLL